MDDRMELLQGGFRVPATSSMSRSAGSFSASTNSSASPSLMRRAISRCWHPS